MLIGCCIFPIVDNLNTFVNAGIEYIISATDFALVSLCDFFLLFHTLLPRLAHFTVLAINHRISRTSSIVRFHDFRTSFVGADNSFVWWFHVDSLNWGFVADLAEWGVYYNVCGLHWPLHLLRAIIIHESSWFVYLRRPLPTLYAHTPPNIPFQLRRPIYLWQIFAHVSLRFPILLVIKVVDGFELHNAVVYYKGIILRYIILTVLIIKLVHRTFLQEWINFFRTNFGHILSVHGSELFLTFSQSHADLKVII